MWKKGFVIVFIFVFCVGVVYAQSEQREAQDKPRLGFGMDFSLGLSSYEDRDGDQVSFQKFAFFPMFTYGKWGLVLDFTFEFDGDFGLRDLDKDGKADRWTTFSDYVYKIHYLRYGLKTDPVYGLVGQFKSYTLGHGLIMEGFTNTLFYPQVIKLGLNFDFDGRALNFPYFGVQAVVDDVLDWDIIGLRAYLRPLNSVQQPLLKEFTVGATVITDLDPQDDPAEHPGDSSSSESVTEFGIDAEMPLLLREDMSLIAYADWAVIFDKGSGAFLGTTYTYDWLKLMGQLRFFGKQFVAHYFDPFYEIERAVKFNGLDAFDEFYVGYLLGTELGLFNIFNFSFFWTDGFTDVEGPRIQTGIGTLSGTIPKFDIAVSYDKKDIDSFSDFFDEEQSLLAVSLAYHVSPSASIVFLMERAYSPYSGGVANRTFVETRFSF
jgi:hypothetical protein